MELFLDTANVDEIRKAAAWGVISGVTTNPTLVAREKGDHKKILAEICDIVEGPVSAEVVSLDADGMVKEARELAKIHPNIVIKIPILPAGMEAVKRLAAEGIRTNVTLIFSAPQSLLAARAGAAFVSPFIGRIDDLGEDGVALLADIVQVFHNYDLQAKIIAASIRHPWHVLEAARLGADIATIPFGVLEKLFKHPLTDKGIERFLEDWRQAMAFQE